MAAATKPVATALMISPGRNTRLAKAACEGDIPVIRERPAIPKA
jgi:hypothetical protein